MKKIFGILSALMLGMFVFTSCQGDPADNDIFIGKYNGKVGYAKVSEGELKADKDGHVTVSKVGKTYSFFFSNNIPALTNIQYKDSDDNTFAAIGLSQTSFIRIKDGHLTMMVIKPGEGCWTADCKR